MADSNAPRKKPGAWPWIFGIVLVAVVIWGVSEWAKPEPVERYVSDCTSAATGDTEMTREHNFAVSCLQQFASSVAALIEKGRPADANVARALDSYRAIVEQLEESDPARTDHAELTRQAATSAVRVMDAARAAWYTADPNVDSAVSEVRQAAQAIDADVPLLQQSDEVRTFFDEAGDALRAMEAARPGS